MLNQRFCSGLSLLAPQHAPEAAAAPDGATVHVAHRVAAPFRRCAKEATGNCMETISELMDHDVTEVSPFDTIRHAIDLMRAHQRDALPVCAGHRLLGVIVGRDAERCAVPRSNRAAGSRVGDVMDRRIPCCFTDQTPEDAFRRIGMVRLSRIPVISHDRRLQGTVSLQDLARRAVAAAVGDRTPDRPGSEQDTPHLRPLPDERFQPLAIWPRGNARF
jgi:CBS domain-containing protein